LASIDAKRETLTVRRTIAGSEKDVLDFLRDTLLPEKPDKPDNPGDGSVEDTMSAADLSGFPVGK
jgi:hypothetical protein